MKPGSTSIARQSETHAPHWMQAIVWVTSTIDSLRHEVLALGHRLLGEQPRRDALDLLPVDRVHVDDQVLDHRHVAHRLDLDHAVAARCLARVEVRVAGERRFAVDAHAARAADRLAAGAADADRAVEAVARLEDRLEHRAVRLELDRVLVPVGRLARLGVIAAQPERELLGWPVVRFARGSACGAASVFPLLGLPLGDRHRRVADLRAVRRRARCRCA